VRLLLPLLVVLALAPSALAAPRVTIYPRHPDPRLTLVVKVTGVKRVPQPFAGIACGGDAPRGDTELNADDGAPLIWDFFVENRCSLDPLTAGVFAQDGREIARRSTTFADDDGVHIVPFLMPRGYAYPLLRPAPGRFYPGARVGLEAAGLPPDHKFAADVRLIGRPHQRRCKIREDVEQGRSDTEGTLTGGEIVGYPAPDEQPFCRGRSYKIKLRDTADDARYGTLTIKIRRAARP
jgi:hypothetical protein